MKSRYKVADDAYAHFVTGTVIEWLPVFNSQACRDILVESLRYSQTHKGLKLFAWVILENHFHAIVAAPDLAQVMRDLKSYTARKICEQLETEKRSWLLEQLHIHRKADRKEYQLWQEGSHPQVLYTDEVIQQKLDYLHANPVKRGWVSLPEHWRYSSAHDWLPGAMPLLTCEP